MEALLVLAALWVAFSNGANDNFKGVATLPVAAVLAFVAAMVLPGA